MSMLDSDQPMPVVMRSRCVNCSLLIPRNHPQHSLQQASTTMITIIQSWITPTELSSESVLCTECMVILQDRASTFIDGNAIPLPAFGHRSLCFSCGKSILRATRTHAVRSDRQERNIMLRKVPLHLVSRLERVCNACWSAAYREVRRQNQHDTNRPILSEVGTSGEFNIPVPPALPQHTSQHSRQPSPAIAKITSAVYRCAANTASHCIFVDCFESERLLIPAAIKQLLLLNHKFYIPPGARICNYHLNHGHWNELTSQLRDFTGTQFDNILNMLQQAAKYHFDFSNIAIMPEYLCHYWLSMTSNQFYDLLNSVPNLSNSVPNATMALCMYLVKLRTGDSNERLATLFEKSRTTFRTPDEFS